MPTPNLTPGCTVRAPRLDDDRDIFALVSAYSQAVVGIPDFTLAEVRDELREPSFPVMPPGLRLRTSIEGESVRRAAHDVRERSFTEHFGEVAQPYGEWVAALESRTAFSWGHVRLAEVDGEPVGMIRTSDQFVEDEGCGYVAQVGVIPSARGRGIAKAMLRWAFAAAAARGLAGTLLHVDSHNTTPALGLDESVGMRTILVLDAWRAERA